MQTSPTERAIQYAERLAQVFPAPETRIRLARLYYRVGRRREAIEVLRQVASEGYVTKASATLFADVLVASNRAEDAVTVLEDADRAYPEDYGLRFRLGWAYAKVHRYADAILVWESLVGHSAAGLDLYIKLGWAHSQLASEDTSAAYKAFDYYRQAFEMDPKEPSLPMLLVNAGLASGRSAEAWNLVSRVDLDRNPYLRRMPAEEGLRLYRELSERQKQLEMAYDAGVIPFSAFSAHAPRPAWFLWETNAQLFRKAFDAGTPVSVRNLVGIPSNAEILSLRHDPPKAIVLDMTALLTLGVLDISRELLALLSGAGTRVVLFEGCLEWLEREISRLRMDQLPAYRRRFEDLKRLLEARADRVEVVRVPVAERPDYLSALGPWGHDLVVATHLQGYYVDDYVRSETLQDLPPVVRSSGDLLHAVVERGLILREEAATSHHTIVPGGETYSLGTVDLARPIIMSEVSLVGWMESGLLAKWLEASLGWPTLVVGPWAWRQIEERVMEGRFYRVALLKAESSRKVVSEGIAARRIQEGDVERGELVSPDIAATFTEFLAPAFNVLSLARKHGAVVWADDLFMRQAFDPRGLLPDAVWARELEAKIRSAFGGIRVTGTQAVLEWLSAAGILKEERRGQLEEQLFLSGYRIMNTAPLLRWWLMRIPYRDESLALPYERLIKDLGEFETYVPESVGVHRKRMFGKFAQVVVIPRLIAEAWAVPDEILVELEKRALSNRLLRIVEEHP